MDTRVSAFAHGSSLVVTSAANTRTSQNTSPFLFTSTYYKYTTPIIISSIYDIYYAHSLTLSILRTCSCLKNARREQENEELIKDLFYFYLIYSVLFLCSFFADS
jgi:hypothetical protein